MANQAILSPKKWSVTISGVINRCLGFFNLELRYKKIFFLDSLLSNNKVSEVYDVGANRGQYARKCRDLGYRGRIFSFEPLIEENRHMQLLAEKDDFWIVVAPVALGSSPGTGSINIAGNSVSSSLLSMDNNHLLLDSKSKYIGVQETPIEKLDLFFQMYHRDGNASLLKLDVQGYEAQVLAGASECIGKIDYIQIELSITNLYSQSTPFNSMNDFLVQNGYELVEIIPGARNSIDRTLAQFDGIYRRIKHAEP